MITSDAQAAWLACALDSEGSLGIYYTQRWPEAMIVITNSSEGYVQYARALVDKERIYDYEASSLKGDGHGKVTMYRVTVSDHEEVLAILKRILPWLIIKKDKAEEMIRFIEGRTWGLSRLTKEDFQRRAKKSWETRKQVPEVVIS